ncbi:putative abieta-7,13-dien-18-ol hydroxylase [Rosa chinensis]|uniref:Putative abieta-7,13-dien-18-ol hydroxylase n=1 Tax=Rosa chinensis TaxID=74649 RepID=A0A2P6QGZ8_ROSCH|nr:putative abieta-7,13-dien-18-ol hydroxylase [Rosa chinensis]
MEANSVGIGKAQKDTSPTTLSWFFCMLDITDAALEQMHHLHAALTEILRLYPAVPLV